MPDCFAGGQVNEFHVLSCCLIAKYPNSLVVDDLQINRIHVTEMGDVAKTLERRFPQLLLLLEIEGDEGTPVLVGRKSA